MENDFYLEKENAGFWLRFAAYIIDGIIINVAIYALMFILGAIGFGGLAASGGLEEAEVTSEMATALGGLYFLFMALSIVGCWLYFALQESSPAMATLGKKAVSIKVTDLEGQRISFARASGRLFGKFVSGFILMIGFIMAGFTEKKQALHDLMAGTLVLKD